MGEAVTVQDITDWDADLRALTDGLGWMFNRPEPKVTFGLMVRALLADVPKKNSWGLAEHAGLATPRPFEHLLDGAVWDTDALRDHVRDYVVAGLGSADAAVVADDTQAIKKGDKSVGVAPQHCGLTGQIENCQVMPMLTYATDAGHAFIDRELYLPESWISDPARCVAAGIPAEREFATKPQLVQRMLARVLAAKVVFGWFAADSGYGRDPGLRAFCHDNTLRYVMAVPVDLPLVDARGKALCCKDILTGRAHSWERRSAGEGSKGARLYDWAMHAVTVKEQTPAPGYGHTLLIRRSKDMRKRTGQPASHDIEYFLVHAPVATTMAAMVRAAGLRWKIEDDNKTGKDQLGLDQYQVRKWTPWYRHVTMCMLAQAFLAVTRAGQGKEAMPGEGVAAC
jgi:SRSO17 transposase